MPDAIRGSVVVNEIHAQPVAGANGYDTDGNGTAAATDEYLEFYNSGPNPVDLGGLQLWDPGSGNWFTFPAGSVLAAGAYAVVVTGVQAGGALPAPGPGGLAFNAARASAIMNNAGDNIFVYDPAANEYVTAGYGNWPLIDPTAPASWSSAPGTTSGLAGFPHSATRIGAGEHFGTILAGDSIQRAPSGSDNFVNDDGETPGVANFCFAGGTLIATTTGPRPAETLRRGDRILAADGRILELRHAMSRQVSVAEQCRDARLCPVRIAAGALGQGLPRRDLLVSRQHRMLVRSAVAQRMFGRPEVLVAAIRLVGLPGIAVVSDPQPICFVHLIFDRHEVILAEGAPSESLHFGPETMRGLPDAVIDEMRLLMPDLVAGITPAPARFMPSGRQQKRLVERLAANRRPALDHIAHHP